MSWERVRKFILGRDNEVCFRCHFPATDVHHRRVKGMGGTKNEKINFGYANLISLCRECHAWIHAHPAKSYELGYLVRSWDEPEEIPIGNITLNTDGTLTQGPCVPYF